MSATTCEFESHLAHQNKGRRVPCALMEFTTTPAEKSTVRLEVTLAVADVAAAIAQAVRHVAGHNRIPGFRPGKAPRSIVERFAGINRILDEATEILIERGYRDAIMKSDVVPLTSPKIDAKPIVEGEAYTFTAVTDRGAEMGDYAIIAFDGYRVDSGLAIEGASSERMPIVIGSDRLIPGFEAQLVGAKVGDATTVEVTFPEDYQEAALQGVPARFDVVINDLRARIPPPLDDAFAAQVANVTDVAGLRAEILMRLKASAVDRGRHEFADKIVEFAMDGATVEIPDPLIEEEIDGLVDELARGIARQGLTFEQYIGAAGKSVEEIRAEMRERGERRARTLLVLSAVAGAEGVEVPEELIDEEVERARPQTQGQRKLEAYLSSERGRRAIRASLRRSLVVERLVDEWFDAHPKVWPAWAPERPATPTAAKASAK